MPVAEDDVTAAELAALARTADRRAEYEEHAYERLALVLFALELTIIGRALLRARADDAVLRVLFLALTSYRSPTGPFRQRWAERFAALMEEHAARVAARSFGVTTLPRVITRAIERRAAELAESVTEVTADRLGAVSRAVQSSVTRAELTDVIVAQRIETLAPLVGRDVATEIMRIIANARAKGSGSATIAKRLVFEVQSVELRRTRATRIARTESIGLANTVEFELAIAHGMTEKRWIDQHDDRVRESHRRCSAQGWIPIREPHANGLQHPGESGAAAEEVIQCRCSEAFR